jgi:hypothetical protein
MLAGANPWTIGNEQHDRPEPSITRYYTTWPIPSGWVIMSVRCREIIATQKQ